MEKSKLGWWWYFNKEDIIMGLVIFILAFAFVFSLSLLIFSGYVDSKCLSLGYPEYGYSYKFIGYCIRTINQTQYVVPLNELLGK